MADISLFLIGIGFAFVVGWIMYECLQMFNEDKQITIPSDIANDIVGETPYCPDCLSHELKLVDITDGIGWLKGHVSEVDWYQCKKCGRVFNDEKWGDAKKYGDFVGIDD